MLSIIKIFLTPTFLLPINNEATRPEFEIVVEGVINAFQFASGKEFRNLNTFLERNEINPQLIIGKLKRRGRKFKGI